MSSPVSFVSGNVTPEWNAVVSETVRAFPWVTEREVREKLEPMIGWDPGAVTAITTAWAVGLWIERRASR